MVAGWADKQLKVSIPPKGLFQHLEGYLFLHEAFFSQSEGNKKHKIRASLYAVLLLLRSNCYCYCKNFEP